MKSSLGWCWVVAGVVCAMGAQASAQISPNVFLAPEPPTYEVLIAAHNGVPINPPVAFIGRIAPGDTVTLEVYGKCWANGYPQFKSSTPALEGYQFQWDYSTYFSGTAGNVLPINFRTITDPGESCNIPPDLPSEPPRPLPTIENPTAAFINRNHPNFVYREVLNTTAVATRNACGYRYIGAVFPDQPFVYSLCPIHSRTYFGSLIVRASSDAEGDFVVCLEDDDNFPATPLITTIIDGRLAENHQGPDFSYFKPFTGTNNDQPRINYLKFNCATIRVEVVDGCDATIVSAVPARNAVDSRRPNATGDATPIGATQIDVNLAITGDDINCITAANFSLSFAGTGSATTSIQGISVVDADTIRVAFTAPIPAGRWTQLTLTTPNATSSTCLGYLPGDVSLDRTTSALDIIRLVDCLNGVIVCSLMQSDLNRSGSPTAADILTEVDLLNGAGEFEIWAGRTLPVSPCGN